MWWSHITGSKPDELSRTPMQWTSGPNASFNTGYPWEPVNSPQSAYSRS